MVTFISVVFVIALLFVLGYFVYAVAYEAGLAAYRRLPRSSRQEIARRFAGSQVTIL